MPAAKTDGRALIARVSVPEHLKLEREGRFHNAFLLAERSFLSSKATAAR